MRETEMSLPAHSALICNLQDSPNHSLFEQNACEASGTLSLSITPTYCSTFTISAESAHATSKFCFITTYSCTDNPIKAQMLIVHSVLLFR